jgi:hypothetical protein
MSFGKLPVELKLMIFETLHDDRYALSAISCVSKTDRQLVEPILYRDISFLDREGGEIVHLLLTLLRRSDLAKRIKSLRICREARPHPAYVNHDVHPFVPRLHNTISVSIQNTMGPCYKQWLDLDLFTDIAPNSSRDGALSIILCLATGVEKVEVSEGVAEVAIFNNLEFKNLPWGRLQNALQVSPLDKLTELTINGRAHIHRPESVAVPPALQTLQIRSCYVSRFKARGPPTCLGTIRLTSVQLHISALPNASTSDIFHRVRDLRIKCVRFTNRNHETVPLHVSSFTSDLRKYAPELEVFECTHVKCYNEADFPPLDIFKHFQHLQHLRIDFDFLLVQLTQDILHMPPRALFPSSLKRLEIVALLDFEADKLCPLYAALFRSGMLGGSNLEYLSFDIWVNFWTPEEACWPDRDSTNDIDELSMLTIVHLKALFESLSKVGITFEAFRQEGFNERFRMLLVGQDDVALFPCSGRTEDSLVEKADDDED